MMGLIALAMIQAAPATAEATPVELSQTNGPLGTSSDQRFDTVGYAGVAGADGGTGVSVTSDVVPAGSFVEVTALDSGRTIAALVSVRGVAHGDVIELSPAAARLIGASGAATAVRVRAVSPIVQDQVELHAGRAASPRIDAPNVLLVALRKRLPAVTPAAKVTPTKAVADTPKTAVKEKVANATTPTSHGKADPPAKNAPTLVTKLDNPPAKTSEAKPAAKPAPVIEKSAKGEGWYVQAATLSSHERAQALANTLGGGRVLAIKNLHRVQIGPFPTQAAATRARDGIVRRGYGGASVIRAQ